MRRTSQRGASFRTHAFGWQGSAHRREQDLGRRQNACEPTRNALPWFCISSALELAKSGLVQSRRVAKSGCRSEDCQEPSKVRVWIHVPLVDLGDDPMDKPMPHRCPREALITSWCADSPVSSSPLPLLYSVIHSIDSSAPFGGALRFVALPRQCCERTPRRGFDIAADLGWLVVRHSGPEQFASLCPDLDLVESVSQILGFKRSGKLHG